MLNISETWKTTYPGASQGLLVMRGVANPEAHAELERRKAELEAGLRARFAGYDRAAFNALPVIRAYNAYYRRFKKSYHVQFTPPPGTLFSPSTRRQALTPPPCRRISKTFK